MAERLRRLNRWQVLVIGAGVALVVTLGLLFVPLVVWDRELRQAPDDSTQWAIFQIQNEFNRTYRAILQYDPAVPQTAADLKLAYDILFSRVDLVDSAPTFAVVRSSAALSSTLKVITQSVHELEPMLSTSSGQPNLAVARDAMNRMEPSVRRLVLDGLQFFAKAADERRQHFSVLLYSISGVVALTILALAAGAALLFMQTSRVLGSERRARESERELVRAQTIANVGSFRWHIDTDEYTCSAQLRRIYGVADGVPFGRQQSLAAIHPLDRERVLRAFDASLANGCAPLETSPSEVEYSIVRPDGSVRRVRDIAHVEFDATGKAAAVVGAVRDITTSFVQREALAERERHLRTAQRLAKVGSYSWDMRTDQIQWSEEIYRIYGIPVGQPITIDDVLDLTDHDGQVDLAVRIEAARTRARDRSSAIEVEEHRLVRRDGEVRIVQTASEVERDESGVPIRLIGTLRDITNERRQADALKAARDEAERANSAKSEFLAVMSHEVRTPMNGVLGMLSALDETPLDDNQRRLCDVARSSAEALLTVLNDILDISKIEAGRLDLEPAPFALRPLITSLVDLYGPQASAKGVRLDYDIQPGTPQRVVGDAGRIRQIVLNYISNAVKFTDAGAIRVAVRAASTRPDRKVVLHVDVVDTGMGIPQDRQSALFRHFNQLDPSFARRFGGTGLGLAISKRLAEMMGGAVGVISAPGKGSTFWLEIPLDVVVAPEGSVGGEAVPQAVTVRPMKILVAEDNATNQMVIRMLLESLGHRVDVANNGLEAVEAASARHYDLVLMDVSMPELDGVEASLRIRALDGKKGAVPIFALTANAMESDRKTFLDAGMQRILLKPLDRKALAAALASVPVAPPLAAHAARTEPSDVFREGALAQLAEDIGEPAVKRLLTTFSEDLHKRQQQGQAAVGAGDLDAIKTIAHSLRGAAAIVGAEKLRGAAGRVDDDIRSGEISDASAAWARLAGEVAEAIAAVESMGS